MSTVWILVSDAARGRLFETTDTHGAWTEVTCYTNPELRGLPQQGRPEHTLPLAQDSTGPARHIIEPHTSRKDKSAQGFAHMIVSDLREARVHHRYDSLLLIAPPHFLGILRAQLGDLDAAGVAGELDNDVVSMPDSELSAYVRRAFPEVFHAWMA